MTQAKKLRKIIEYAVEQGLEPNERFPHNRFEVTHSGVAFHGIVDKEFDSVDLVADFRSWQDLLFNHSFARAVFGYGEDGGNPYWKRHLRELAITPEEDRIDYIYETIKEKRRDKNA